MHIADKINYVELPATDIEASKAFFQQLFSWKFVDYGPDYTAFSDQGIDGGFFKSELQAKQQTGSALIVFYSDNLQQLQQRVELAGGSILKPVYSFPGGRRFHFSDPSGNEFAAWSEQ